AEASQTALYDFLVAAMDGKKRVILGMSGDPHPSEDISRSSNFEISDSGAFELNSNQQKAIDRAINCEVFHLIWGPPGTGKTKVIPEIVQRVQDPVLLGAFTNTAVDKMLISLLDRDPKSRFLRVGRASDSPEVVARLQQEPAEFFTEDLAIKYGTVRAVHEALQQAWIVAATAHRASTMPY